MRRLLSVMVSIAGLAGILLLALPGMGQTQYRELSTVSTRLAPQQGGSTRGLWYWTDDEGEYWYWENPVAQAAIGRASAGSFGFGPSNGAPASAEDNFLWYIQRSTPLIYIDNGGGIEIQPGVDGIMDEEAQVDVNTHSASFKWHTNETAYKLAVEFKMWLVRDVLRYEYKITNKMPQSMRIGFRTIHDLTWGRIPPDDWPENLDGEWTPITAGPYFVSGSQQYWDTRQWKDAAVPEKWFVRTNNWLGWETPPSMRYMQPLTVAEGVTRPTRLIFAKIEDLENYGWLEILEESLPENANEPPFIQEGIPFDLPGFDEEGNIDREMDVVGVGLYYPIQPLGFGQTRTVTGEFRLDWATVKTMNQQYALALHAPEYLDYMPGDNPDTTEEEDGYISPETFTIDSYVFKSSVYVEPTASLAITLGKGLVLDPPIQQQPLFRVQGIVEDHKHSWTVRADGSGSGVVPITVTTFFNPGGSITTTRYVNVPAVPKLTSMNLVPASSFTGFPFTYTNDDAMTVLARVSEAIGNGFELAWWDPTMPGYRYARPHSLDQLTLQPGRGYWLKIPESAPSVPEAVPLVGATPLDQTRTYDIRLDRGWNAISNPYQYSIMWGYCYIVYQNQQYQIADAIKKGLIRREMWIWDPTSQEYNPPTNPYPRTELFGELKPYEGYWLYATERMSLVYTPNIFLPPMGGRAETAKPTRTPGSQNQWQVQMAVSTSKGRSKAMFGISPTDQDGISDGDMMAPPIGPSGLSLYFPRRNWGSLSANYAADLQAPGTEKSWPVEVNCAQPNEQIVLRWPDLTQVPANVTLVLTDELTGQRVAMRTAPAYTFNSGQGGVRRFTVTMTSGGQSLRFTSTLVHRASTRNTGAVISCGLTVPAQVTVRIRSTGGRLVRTLGPTEVNGQGNITWDGRDDHNRILPAGIYTGEVFAEASDGQRIRAIVTISTRN
ncbi:MAG: FlgD immunoglobulin-like domain containing protein [Armatimonadota bacterium]